MIKLGGEGVNEDRGGRGSGDNRERRTGKLV